MLKQKTHSWVAAGALLSVLWAAPLAAQEVVLHGVFPGRAVISVAGGAPRAVAQGSSFNGVKVISVLSDSATLEVQGQQRVIRLGESASYQSSSAASADPANLDPTKQRAVLQSDGRGHFTAQGHINGVMVNMVVDTGASLLVLPASEAKRLGLNYRERGTPSGANTANGPIPTWNLSLDSVKVQGITLYNVAASVVEAPLNHILLGNSFLNRVQMQREGERMVMIQRF